MAGVPYVKAHALGNDFLLVEDGQMGRLSPAPLALLLCDRHSGVGADGLVVLGPVANGAASFRIFNADGSEAELSGNALRCAAAWLLARSEFCPAGGQRAAGAPHQPPVNSEIRFETRVGPRPLYFLGRAGAAWLFRAEIGAPAFEPAQVPFHPPRPVREPIVGFPLPVGDAPVGVTILSMGNPQCVLFVEDFDSLDWQGLGAEIERHPYFPERTNVGFVRVHSAERIEARFWERGAGHTSSSGTGACACVVAAHLAQKTGRRAAVAVERGEVEVNWRADGVVELTGPAEIVAAGEFYSPGV